MLPHDRHTAGTTQSPPSPLESVIATYTDSQSRGTTTNAGSPSHDRQTHGLDVHADLDANNSQTPTPNASITPGPTGTSHEGNPTAGPDLHAHTATDAFVAPDPTGSSLAKLTLKGMIQIPALTFAAIDSRLRVDNYHLRFQCPATSCHRISPADKSYADFAKHVSIHASEFFSRQLNVCKFDCPVS